MFTQDSGLNDQTDLSAEVAGTILLAIFVCGFLTLCAWAACKRLGGNERKPKTSRPFEANETCHPPLPVFGEKVSSCLQTSFHKEYIKTRNVHVFF